MSPSRPFILRPVATSLLMAAILLVGIVAFTQLPVSALPEVDYPTIQVLTFYPGASPDVMATTVTAPLERQFGADAGPEPDDLDERRRRLGHRAAVQSLARPRRRRRRSPVGHQRRRRAFCPPTCPLRRSTTRPIPPTRPSSRWPSPPTPCRCRRSKTWSIRGWRPHLAVDRRRPGQHQRRTKAGRAHPGQSGSALLLRTNMEDVRTALTQASVNSAKGNFDGPRQDYQIDANDQITDAEDYKNVVIAYSNGAPVFVKDVANVVNGVENTKQAAWMNQTPGGHSEYSAPARRQHHHRRQPNSQGPAAARGQSARLDQRHHHDRHDHQHSGLGPRRRVRADAHHRPGRHGHLPFPAQPARHHHSQRRRAALAGRHLRASCTCWATASTTSR